MFKVEEMSLTFSNPNIKIRFTFDIVKMGTSA